MFAKGFNSNNCFRKIKLAWLSPLIGNNLKIAGLVELPQNCGAKYLQLYRSLYTTINEHN